jgi:mannose-6-phosphate isomerase-like protein (cupin superfamily)
MPRMASEAQVTKGDGWAVATLDSLGEGPGFRKIRGPLGVTAFGVNALVVPPGYGGPNHYHEEQEELYFVHSGRARFEFGDGATHELGPGGVVWADAPCVRRFHSIGDEDLVLFCVGGKDGYVGRDGRLPDGEDSRVRQS